MNLLAHSKRKCPYFLHDVLADDFKEYGKFGRVYTKKDILNALPNEEHRKFSVRNLDTQCLENNVYLVTYTTIEKGTSTLRSSIWKVIDNKLQIVFHQGTIICNVHMNQQKTVIYLIGKPGVGKYTIAMALSKKTEMLVCDNQLINNPIFELCHYDGYREELIPDCAWDTIAKIRTNILDFLTKVPEKNGVLTNCLAETSEDRKIYEQVKDMANVRRSLFIPVRLYISKDEHLKRLTRPERRKRWKSINPHYAEDNGPLLSISHPNLIDLEISHLNPDDVAEKILNHIQQLNPAIAIKKMKDNER